MSPKNFSASESATLARLLSENLDADWESIANMLGTGRSPEGCRKHASKLKMRDRHGRGRNADPTAPVVAPAVPLELPLELPVAPVVAPAAEPAVAPVAPRTEAERLIADLLAAERIRARRELLDEVRALLLRLTVEV